MHGMFMVLRGAVELVKDLSQLSRALAEASPSSQTGVKVDKHVNSAAKSSIGHHHSVEPEAAASSANAMDQLAQGNVSQGGFSGSVDLDDSHSPCPPSTAAAWGARRRLPSLVMMAGCALAR